MSTYPTSFAIGLRFGAVDAIPEHWHRSRMEEHGGGQDQQDSPKREGPISQFC